LTLQLQLGWQPDGRGPQAGSVSPKPFPFFGFLLAIPTTESSTRQEKRSILNLNNNQSDFD